MMPMSAQAGSQVRANMHRAGWGGAPVAARGALADERLRELELLLDVARRGAAVQAAEGAEEELRADLARARHGALRAGAHPA